MTRKKKAEEPNNENQNIEKPPKKAKKKTYTIEEKALILQDIFSSKHEVYSIKELEKLVPKKSNGVINSMQLKEVLDYCINENMVTCEKCGISNSQKMFLETLQKQTTELKNEYEDIVNTQGQWILDNENLIKKKEKESTLDNEIEQLKSLLNECDTESLQNNIRVYNDQSNIIRDNIFSLIGYIKAQVNLSYLGDNEFLSQLGIIDAEIELLNNYED
ncbi:hypothetical protein ACO0OL_003067 [Hanseniaspora opuntiae]